MSQGRTIQLSIEKANQLITAFKKNAKTEDPQKLAVADNKLNSVNKESVKDISQIFNHYYNAAMSGSATALTNLLMMYYEVNVVQMNDVQAVELLRLAAEQGVIAAKNKLKEVYSACESYVYDLPIGVFHSAMVLRSTDVKKGFNELAEVRPNLFKSLIESESWAKVEPLLNREHAKKFHPDYKWFWAQPAPDDRVSKDLKEIEMVTFKASS